MMRLACATFVQFSERTKKWIEEFGTGRFPSNWDDWKGIGEVSSKALEVRIISLILWFPNLAR